MVSLWFAEKQSTENTVKKCMKGNEKSRGKRVCLMEGLLQIMTIKGSWLLKLLHTEISSWYYRLKKCHLLTTIATQTLKPEANTAHCCYEGPKK